MEVFDQLVLAMSASYLELLEVLAVLMYLINLPFVGVVMGSLALSMWLSFSNREIPNPRFERFAGELIDRFLSNKMAMFVLGVFPLLSFPIIYGQWFTGTGAQPLKYIPWVIPIVALAFGGVIMYRNSYATRANNPMHYMHGLGALGMFKLGYLILFGATARLHDPEKWYRVKDVIIMLLNFNVVWKFLIFMHFAGAVTGVAILFFFFKWNSESTDSDPDYALLVKRFGGGLGLAFSLAIPVFTLFYVFTTPDVAFDNGVYLLATLTVFTAMLVAMFMLGTLGNAKPRWIGSAMTFLLACFMLSSAGDLRSMARANQEHARLIEIEDEAQAAARHAEIESRLHADADGEEVFKRICSTCHAMDTKIVGPPLNDVLPKYKGKIADLMSYIDKPSKQDPAYPAMPEPPVNSAEVKAVAEYLLGESAGDAGASSGGH